MTLPTVVDFFSGCGGTSQGFSQAGLPVALGIDNDADSARSFQRNFSGAGFLEKDVRGLSAKDLDAHLPSGPLLFAGCAPCQPFSRQNRHKTQIDPRRDLLGEFGRLVAEIKPAYVVVENVPGMQRIKHSEPLDAFRQTLVRNGYHIQSAVLKALNFGVPQERQRLVLVASLVGDVLLPTPTHGEGCAAPSTVRDAIGRLPRIENGTVHPGDPDHVAMKLTAINLDRIRATPEGGDRRDWPDRLRLPCHRRHSGHSDVYGRLSWDRPSSGLTTRCISYSNGRFGHPVQDRAISVREAACLQTFPDDFAFHGSMTSKARQIGNAVPPLMAQRIAEAICGTTSA